MERWQQIESLFQEALQHDPIERDAWLREVCRDDSGLRREVSSLLANHHEATDFAPWAAAAAAELVGERASLQTGQRLGPYEILAPIGKGGMGEVYKARDTRLKRDVAIKICAAQFSERFEREARVIAALNHPHICQLYDVGPNFLVMELVEGENLSGPLAVETALDYARQIAEALEAAHEKGIVHRDLKPANVKITPAGVVKVLDFGLAKAAGEPSGLSRDPSISPTMTMSPTRAGMILGTAPYMAPEQARGAAVDRRADIWAFGCVLYEMLSGEQTFHGETTSDILAAVLKEEPDWSRIPARAQPLLRRCLVKDRKHRLRDIGDAMLLLDAEPELVPAQRPWIWIGAVTVTIALAVVTAVGWWQASHSVALRPLARLSAELPPDTTVDRLRSGNHLALSPDGTRIAIIERDGAGKSRVAVRRLDQDQFTPLSGTEGATTIPFFSPDGQWIGFSADGKLKKVAVQGGVPVTLCEAANPWGASWGDDGNILTAFNQGTTGLLRVPSGGGTPAAVTKLNKEKSERAHAWPQVLPDSQAVLFTVASVGSYEDANIDVLSFQTGQRKTIHRGGFFGRYLPSGHLLYLHQNTLFAAPFDVRRLAVTGAPQPVLEDVSNSTLFGSANFDSSSAHSGSGTLAYANWKGERPWSILWLDSADKTPRVRLASGYYHFPRLSPDGKRLALVMNDRHGHTGIWVLYLDRAVRSLLTHLPGLNHHPVWTPDGKSIFFQSTSQPDPGIYRIRADGAGEAQRLTDGNEVPHSFSADGKRLAYDQLNADGHSEIWTAPLEGEPGHPRLGKAELFLRAPFSARSPRFSPDGRWLAYNSDETGTFEVYVRTFSGQGATVQISTGGGLYPIWSPGAGHDLFFLARDGRIMVAGYTAKGDSFTAGKPRVWSQTTVPHLAVFVPYDVAPDGKHFVVAQYPTASQEEEKPTDSVTVLLNFFDELRRRVPAGGQ